MNGKCALFHASDVPAAGCAMEVSGVQAIVREGFRWIFAVLVVVAHSEQGMCENEGEVNVSRHLGVAGRVNLGSYYTPARYVRTVGVWLRELGIGAGWTIADLSCGYGAFFELAGIEGLDKCRYVGNDIDPVAVGKARQYFPHVMFSEGNALFRVSRKRFGFQPGERIVIVGNPPYNDTTSQAGQSLKTASIQIDADLKTRDLGMSSLLAYDKIQADYVAVLHPLSYLIKKQNFSAARAFFANYALVRHVVFSSREFAGTSRAVNFPVVVALYRRTEGRGLSYEDVRRMWFGTVEGNRFSLSGFDYVTDEIDKYPVKRRYHPEILFYTLRDMNALHRSRTFLVRRIPNAVDVDPAKLAYYCYVDCFKRFAEVPYYLGNFNIPFIRDEFVDVKEDVVQIAKYAHPDVFGEQAKPERKAYERVRKYISRSIKGKECPHAD